MKDISVAPANKFSETSALAAGLEGVLYEQHIIVPINVVSVKLPAQTDLSIMNDYRFETRG